MSQVACRITVINHMQCNFKMWNLVYGFYHLKMRNESIWLAVNGSPFFCRAVNSCDLARRGGKLGDVTRVTLGADGRWLAETWPSFDSCWSSLWLDVAEFGDRRVKARSFWALRLSARCFVSSFDMLFILYYWAMFLKNCLSLENDGIAIWRRDLLSLI